MDKNIATLILDWHMVYVKLGECIESARVVLDQTDRGTLLPDRVREMRGEMLTVQEQIPALADLLEELTGKSVWPTDDVDDSPVADPIVDEPEPETLAEVAADGEVETVTTGEGDYDADGSTPVEEAVVESEAAAEVVVSPPQDVDADSSSVAE